MIVTIDNLAQRYGILPSRVLNEGTSFDMFVMHMGTMWMKKRYDEQNNISASKPVPKLSIEEMKAMIQRARSS